MNKVCSNCGNANPDEMTFCVNCGHSLAASSSGGVGSSYPSAGNSAMFAGGMPPALPTLPARGSQKKSKAWVWILGVVGVLGVLLIAGLVGVFALLSSFSKPQRDGNLSNQDIVSTSPAPNSNRGISFNSNSISGGNTNAGGNSNSNRNTNTAANTVSNRAGGGGYSLTENMVLSEVTQPQVGEFKLDTKESAPEWKTDTGALEAENHYYSSSKGIKPTVTIVRYTTSQQAQQTLRNSMAMYKNRNDTTTPIQDTVNKADQSLIGITATAREKKTNTYRLYWTDGKFLFIAGIVGDKAPAESWMNNSKY